MKKALFNSLFIGIGIFIFAYICNFNSRFYSAGMFALLDEDFPGFMQVVEDYGINSQEPVYEGFTKEEVVALEALYNRSFRMKEAEADLNQRIKEADPFKNSSNDEMVKVLKGALNLVQQIKEKYYVKAKIIDGLFQAVPIAFFILILSMIGELISRLIWGKEGPSWERDYEAEQDNRSEEEAYPSRRIVDKPKGLN